jgi:hypothetical protein
MTEVAPRHALIVATQSASMNELKHLGDAAKRLHASLTDPEVGACVGAVKGDSLLLGELAPREVIEAVRSAVARAGEEGATLVLGFLGHGFAASVATLCLMGKGSIENRRRTSINITDLLAEAVDEPGVNGVLAIVDVCSANTAPPAIADLTTGSRNGRVQLSALTAAMAGQPAKALRLSRAIVDVMHEGVADTDPHLSVTKVHAILQARISGQDVGCFQYGADRFATPLWLARNLRHPAFAGQRPLPTRRPPDARLAAGELTTLIRMMVAIPAVADLEALRKIIRALPEDLARDVIPPRGPGINLLLLLHALENRPELDPWRALLGLLREAESADPRPVEALADECRKLGLLA